MKRRVFVAIRCHALEHQALEVQRILPVRWVKGKNLHITLVPPWYEEDIDKVKEGLQRLKKHTPFTVTFDRVTPGPDPKRPRLIWATGETTKAILDLHEHTESALGAHHDKPFRLHMTLARLKPEDLRALPAAQFSVDVRWTMPVRSVALMESLLSSAGAEYEVLDEITFSTD
jgi:RNA 2',3'-cyclic 3'-phosphodiesterase